jgi:hypothetical protein
VQQYGGGWGFCARFLSAGHVPLAGLTCALNDPRNCRNCCAAPASTISITRAPARPTPRCIGGKGRTARAVLATAAALAGVALICLR